MFFAHGEQGAERLLARDGDRYRDNKHLQRFVQLIRDGYVSFQRATRPREPLSVQCHGDFNRNNLMFRYDEGGRRPVDTLMFDFGRPRYGSPALDLSYLLYMNTTQRMRETQWPNLLDAYCSELLAAVPPGVSVPDRTEMEAEMAMSAFFGVIISLFFQSYIITYNLKGKVDSAVCDLMIEQKADMVQHIVDMGYTNV